MADATPTRDPLARLLLQPDRLRLRYAYAAALTHRAIDAGRTDAPEPVPGEQAHALLETAEAHLWATLRLAAATTRAFGARPPRYLVDLLPEREPRAVASATDPASVPERARRRTSQFLIRSFVPSATVLLAGVLLEAQRLGVARGRDVPAPAQLVGPVEEAADNYRVTYNLACFWSSSAAGPGAPTVAGDPGPALERALRHLDGALVTAPGATGRALARWATEDPSLAELRRAPQTGSRFDSLVATYLPPAPADGGARPGTIADLRAVGPVVARRLAEVGISRPADVGDDPALAQVVAGELRLPVPDVARWLDAVRLLSLPGMTPALADRLAGAGWPGLVPLAHADAVAVRATLGGMDEDGPGGAAPTLERIDHWVAEARRRTSPGGPGLR